MFALPRLSSVVKKLIIALFVAYVLELVCVKWLQLPFVETLAMWPGAIAPWQLVTYVVVNGGDPIMFLLGLLFLWWAISPFEIGNGSRRTVQLVAVATIAASVPAYLVGMLIPGSPPLAGSVPLWCASVAAVAWLQRDQQIALFGVVPMAMKHLLIGLVVVSVLQFLFTANQTMLVANLSAMAAGIGFVRWMKRPRTQRAARKPAARARGFKVIRGGGGEDEDRPKWLN
jgi:hypothetical protein